MGWSFTQKKEEEKYLKLSSELKFTIKLMEKIENQD